MIKSVISYGVYLPYLRIKREEYINALGSCGSGIKEKAVLDIDEDVITMAVEAAQNATLNIDIARIGVLALASANFPYQEKAMAGTVIEALGLRENVLTIQHSGSTLAGTEAFLAALGMLEQTEQKYALVIVSDAPSADISSDLEQGFGAAACAFVLAKDEPGLELEGIYAHAGESLGLRYRLPGETSVRDIGVKAYAAQAYNHMVKTAVRGLIKKHERNPGDYRHVVLHQEDLKTPLALAKKLGFNEQQLDSGMVYGYTGDTGACSPLLGLCRALNTVATGEKIIICSYGSGAGSHALSFKVTQPPKTRTLKPISGLWEKKKYIGYIHYLKLKRSI